jgi:DNA-binding FadR family transcriptional regulator
VKNRDSHAIIERNYDLHSAIAAACHNRCIERGYRQMLADKQRLAQHGLPGTTFEKGQALSSRFRGTARISRQLVRAIERKTPAEANRTARALNEFVRCQVMEVLASSLGQRVEVDLQVEARAPQAGQKKAQP